LVDNRSSLVLEESNPENDGLAINKVHSNSKPSMTTTYLINNNVPINKKKIKKLEVLINYKEANSN